MNMINSAIPDLSIIIVNWNVSHLLDQCLATIYSAPQGMTYEVIVVDSASSDDSVAMVRSKYPEVKLLAQTENVGFTRGNNLGLEIATGRYLLLLNPDTEVMGDALHDMVQYLDNHPTVGIVGPHTLNTDGSHQSTRRRFPNRNTAIFEGTWMTGYAPKHIHERYYCLDIHDDSVAEVDWVQGSALMARREIYIEIGGLNTDFVMFYEETDWCKRAKASGWQVVYLGTSKIIHHGGQSTDQVGARKHIYFQSSKIRYFRIHDSEVFASFLYVFLYLSYVSQVFIEGFKLLLRNKPDLRKQRLMLYQEVLRSGFRS